MALQNWISGLLVVGLRLSGFVLYAPPFSGPTLFPRVKAGIVIVLTALLYPVLSSRLTPLQPGTWPIVVIMEAFVGVALGIAANTVFEAAQMAGQVLSIQMGYSLVNILDPQTQVDTTVVSMFHQSIVTLIFFSLNCHLRLVQILAHSFDALPVGAAHLGMPIVTTLLSGAASIFGMGIQLAAPVLVTTLLADLVLGFIAKASPQLPVMLLGPALKTVLGLTLLGVALRSWPSLLANFFQHSLLFAERIWGLMN